MTTFRLRALALSFFVAVAAQAQPLTLTGTMNDNGILNGFYSSGLVASGGVGTYTWDISGGALPGGLSINPVTGVISGTPTTALGHQFMVRVTDQADTRVSSQQGIYVYPALTVNTQS